MILPETFPGPTPMEKLCSGRAQYPHNRMPPTKTEIARNRPVLLDGPNRKTEECSSDTLRIAIC